MKLPPRRKPPKSGIARAPRRVFPRHEKWVRGHACCVPDCLERRIQFHHVRSAATAGTGLKSPSWHGIPACVDHHREIHQIGIDSFERRYGLDLEALAAELARRSPDRAMREAMEDGRGAH